MNALDEARHLIAMRSHRKVVATRLTELRNEARIVLNTAIHNENSEAVFGTRTDRDVAERLTQTRDRILDDLTWAIDRLETLNAEDLHRKRGAA